MVARQFMLFKIFTMKTLLIFITVIFCFACKPKEEQTTFDAYSKTLPLSEEPTYDSAQRAEYMRKKDEPAEDDAFTILNEKISEKTGKDVCYILEDINLKCHYNNVFIKEKYNNNWSAAAYDELEKLNKKTIAGLLKNYCLTLDEFVEMTQKSIDICHLKY